MGSFSIWHWLVVGILVLLLFGKGRFSDMMGDVAKGLKSFKKGMADDDNAPPPAVPPRQIDGQRAGEPPAAPPSGSANTSASEHDRSN